ncbi:MAG: hypothetical protein JNL13_09155 [Chitinophagaceae bacterium]|nr:hypothetical protein [Chitinophagaceae bacterium]
MSLLIRNEYYLDVLSAAELAFLQKAAGKQDRTYRKILRAMLIGAVIISFGGGWKNIYKEGKVLNTETVFSWENYFITLALLCLLFYIAVRFSRSGELTKIQLDLRQKTKIVERVTIEKKTFLPHNNTFHFYLNSAQKLSIQVEQNDFAVLSEGDEINIEYSKNAGVYFGYF